MWKIFESFSSIPCVLLTHFSVAFVQVEDEVDEVNMKVFSELERKLKDS